ncbi:MAG: deoxynucleoside kinase [Planctomycetota bacterium]
MTIDRFRYIAVEGPIGVGKSTLAKGLAKELGARLVEEEAVDASILAHYYGDVRRYAFQTQIYFLASRYKQIQELRQSQLFEAPRVVADFFFEKDLIFAQCFLTGDEFAIYENLYNSLLRNVVKPDFVILLQADVEVIMDRIELRGHKYEFSISRDYMEELIDGYDRFFFNYTDAPLLIINTNEVDYRRNSIDVKDIARQIGRHDAGIQYYVPLKK